MKEKKEKEVSVEGSSRSFWGDLCPGWFEYIVGWDIFILGMISAFFLFFTDIEPVTLILIVLMILLIGISMQIHALYRITPKREERR